MKHFLTHGGFYTPAHPEYRRTVLLNITLAVFIAVSAAFAVLNALVFKLFSLVWVDLVAMLLAVTLAAVFRWRRQIDPVALATVSLLAVFLLAFVWLVGNRFNGLVWLTIFPGLAFFLLGSRRGLMACLAFFGAVALLLGLQAPLWEPQVFGPESAVNIAAALLCLMLQAHFHEQSRQDVLAALRERNVELERLSTTDRLTGLANRMSLERSLQEEVERRARGGEAFSVLLLDLDHFKRVNDSFGHATGDAVLQALARLLDRERRATDRAGRWGGEEFVVVCPHADAEGALQLAERLRAAVAAQVHPQVGQQTVSIGVASHVPGEGVDALMARADAALYAAKHGGRNRVVAHAEDERLTDAP